MLEGTPPNPSIPNIYHFSALHIQPARPITSITGSTHPRLPSLNVDESRTSPLSQRVSELRIPGRGALIAHVKDGGAETRWRALERRKAMERFPSILYQWLQGFTTFEKVSTALDTHKRKCLPDSGLV
ncbi:hypothetical protein NMY22_g18050 [Coprinellus aureogranulatus]|nr:hypothetical protein NMY22_g18050 [Coprinellus aureogranulatus]